ncbi:MAG: ROK family protein [Arthrobacter oryzae]
MQHVIGIDLGGTKTAAAVVAADGTVLYPAQTPTRNRDGGEAILAATAGLIRSLRAQAAADGIDVTAVGIGAAGVINAGTGTVVSATDAILGWTGTDIRDRLGDLTGLAVSVVNDVHAHAIGEAWLGAAAGSKSSLMVAFGTGVGGSFILDGHPVLGHRFVGGHVGHIASPYAYHDGAALACSCGHAGHVEAIASGPAIHASFRRFGGPSSVPDTRAVFDLARVGDSAAHQAIAAGAAAAGQAVGGLANILDPEVIVVSGGLADAGAAWWDPMVAAARRELLAPLAGIPVHRAKLGNTAAIVGAAHLVLKQPPIL